MKIIKHIPNSITSMNLLCGAMGVIFTMRGEFSIAFYLMLAAAVCDFFDGFCARMLNAYSPLGKELDSLADLISFGLLPSIMLHKLMCQSGTTGFLSFIPLAIAVFSALRLAKFNIDERQAENFIGLPTPACAMLCGSFVYYVMQDPASVLFSWAASRFFIPAGALILSFLLISEIPMFSMKFKKGASADLKWMRASFIAVSVAALAATLILGQHFSHAVLFIFLTYIVMNILHSIIYRK